MHCRNVPEPCPAQVDPATDVTLNVALAPDADYEGGRLYLEHEYVDDNSQKSRVHVLLRHARGTAIVHRGSVRHGALRLERGRRANLIVWCRARGPAFPRWRELDASVRTCVASKLGTPADLCALAAVARAERATVDDAWPRLSCSHTDGIATTLIAGRGAVVAALIASEACEAQTPWRHAHRVARAVAALFADDHARRDIKRRPLLPSCFFFVDPAVVEVVAEATISEDGVLLRGGTS
mmetsp:Transcript_2607/g.10026  ORF Transcript_2607/g.10026 Transcript_2607/m.10026 type:complete len:239 (-) Transcript_2607:94-810(-)